VEAHSEPRTSEKATSRVRPSAILSKFSACMFTRWGRSISLNLDDSTYELVNRTANMKGLSFEKALRLLLRRGIVIHDSPAELRRQIDLLREEKETLARCRDELARSFSRFSGEYSTLRYRYYEAFSENRILAMHLCGRGLASKFSDLVERYIFTKLY